MKTILGIGIISLILLTTGCASSTGLPRYYYARPVIVVPPTADIDYFTAEDEFFYYSY